jgi:signal transduction histidine kinase
MPVSIRSRLLLLVLAWMIPAMAGALWMIHVTAQAEREAHERRLQQSARALSLVVDRELTQRRALATAMAASRALDRLPQIGPAEAQVFVDQAREAMQGLQGWIEVSVVGRVLLDTRSGAGEAPPERDRPPAALVDRPVIRPLQGDADTPLHASIIAPVRRQGRIVGNVAVTIVPAEMQAIVDGQRLPDEWLGTVLDNSNRVVARHPGGVSHAGRPATEDLQRRLRGRSEGAVEAVSLDGADVTGFFSTSPQGWTYVTAMPQTRFGGFLQKAVIQVGIGALVLLALAVAGALWVSRSIARPVTSLKLSAARMQAGESVTIVSTGIAECDEVVAALAETAETLQHARVDLERQVAEAVARTRDAEQRLSHSQRVEALGRLTGGVAHDFNNLLGVVSNSARLVQRHAGEQPALQTPVAAILRAVEAGSRLTQQLLRFAGRRPVTPQALALARWLPELAELVGSVAGERIRVDIAVAPDTRPVTVDSSELELAIINLALNARDALPAGGRLEMRARNATRAELDGLAPGDYVAIDISDDGPGVNADVSARVFEPFFTTKAVGRGTGLGLAQVHGFCTQAGGTARLASRAGAGTTVTLLLPASTTAPAPGPAAGPALPAQALHGVRVLVVEDNEDLGATTAALLVAYGAAVERAAGPEPALHMVDTRGPFDAVLSDVVMPGPMDGLALARALRERHPKLPVVLISGFSTALAAAHDFVVLRKPCADDELVGTLLAAVGGPVEPDPPT